ncbi:MAG: [FeFe] hydrogenase H-cluster radical SAM maturase HydE [Clostridia bacterium]|nr:[FeFe] hydrogenase H-cluster radical SAM maturase HydE [Clostridia bacterium]
MKLTDGEILVYLRSNDQAEVQGLFSRADQLRHKQMGKIVYLRGIIEFSNYCRKNCSYCGLRRGNKKLKRYRMTGEEILAAALQARQLGYQTVVLQSGEDPDYSGKMVAGLIREIVRTGLTVTLSLGERSKEDYALWREAGAKRYLLRHETANPTLYQRLHPDADYCRRLACLSWLKELGYQVGAGSMVGLPGQQLEDLLADLRLLEQFDVEMAGIGPFIPHPDTPLAGEIGGTLVDTLKMVALTRLVMPGINIPATTALGSLHQRGREMGLECGANVIMPNATPAQHRLLYQLYPDKICLDESPDICRHCIEQKIIDLNRETDLVSDSSRKIRIRGELIK